MASALRQNNSADDADFSILGVTWAAQTFTPQVSHKIDQVDLYVHTAGTPGDFTVSIKATDVNGHPTGNDLCSVTMDGDTLPGSKTWVSFVFDSFANLEVDVKYAIVCRCPDAEGSANSIYWRADSSDTYARGNLERSANSGVAWSEAPIEGRYDLAFKEYGGEGSGGTVSADSTYTKKLVAIAENELWYESSEGTMSVLVASQGDGELDVGEPLSMCEAYGKIFIVNGSRKKVADFINVKITTTDLGAHPPDHGTVLTGGTSGAKMVVDYITNLDDNESCTIYGQRITTATFTGETVTGLDNDANAISFTGTAEVAGPHWYDWTSYGNAADDDTTYGELPDKVTLVGNYRGRVTVSGDPEHPHQWYMPRQSNPWDWVYASVDAGSAVAGGNQDAGEIGDIVITLIPYKDDYLGFGCANSIWYLTGDPMEGGSLTELDLTTGMFGPRAYCWDGESNLYFWGTNGIYKTTIPGRPVCISQIRLPDLIKDTGANASTHRITLAYDRRKAGILICITKISDGTNSNYWLDLRSEGLFPETYPEECGVFSAFYYEAVNPDYQKLIIGCNDGYLRIFDVDAVDDDIGDTDEAIESYMDFGPIPLSDNPKYMGKIVNTGVETAGGATGGSDSDDITCKIFIANSAREIIKKLVANTGPNFSGTITSYGRRRGSSIKRKLSGNYAGIRLENVDALETWGLEQLWLDIMRSGRFK